ncbi:MAG: DUF6134 family protein [Arenicellales bacterium]|jgi:hypothetical protein
MKTPLLRIFLVAFTSLIVSNMSFATASHSNDTQQSWNFKVLLDDKPIGYHQVSIDRQANRKAVHTKAEFDVRFMFIPVYSYIHDTRETWENGCLVNITSTTDDNGDDFFINSKPVNQRLALETQDGMSSYDGCVRTFAYWDIEMLQSTHLLNTQTGKYQAVTITDMGRGMVNLENNEVEARRFKLIAEDMTIDLWYTDDMHWLALESTTASGAVLRYVPQSPVNVALESQS